MSRNTIVVDEEIYTKLKQKAIDLRQEKLKLIHELEALKSMIREHSHNPELLRSVGPSRAELEAQADRVRQLNRLNYDEDRETWKKVMDACQVFESRYC